MGNLKEELNAVSGLSERRKIIFSMFPGLLLGFTPPNFDQMIQRFDCSTCQEILKILKDKLETEYSLQENIIIFRKPTQDRNNEVQKKYKSLRKIPLFGRFFKQPKLESIPDFTNKPWYAELTTKLKELEQQLKETEQKDPKHWGDKESREISKKFTSAYFLRDKWETSQA